MTVARLLDVPEALIRGVSSTCGRASRASDTPAGSPTSPWPGGSLGAFVQQVVDVLGYADVPLTLTAMRRWDPELREVRTLGP